MTAGLLESGWLQLLKMPSKADALIWLFLLSLAADVALIGPHPGWLMIPAALFGWYLADLGSGLVHMYMDYRPCIPGTGLKDLYFWEGSRDSPEFLAKQREVYARISTFERVVYDFKKHHPFPDLLGRHSLWHLMKAPVAYVTLPLSLALNLVFGLTHPPGWLIVGAITYLLGISLSQGFHGALHRSDVGWGVRAMRRVGLLMTQTAHQKHHATLVHDFAVINGWSNPLVNVCTATLLRLKLLRSEGLEPT
jgi:hypothetical protein